MAHEVLPLPFKPHRLAGFSERLLVSHYVNNYGGAVRRLNAIETRLAGVDWRAGASFEINGLDRERLIAANSMILHEAYFNGLGGSGEPTGLIAEAIERDFGSLKEWRAEFIAMAKALGGGSGWVCLARSARLGRLINHWAADHAHNLADGEVLLALDMYEHAYALDYGANASAYVDAFMGNIAWPRIETRLRSLGPARGADAPASSGEARITAADLRARLAAGEEIAIVDVCLSEDLDRRSDMIPGARFVPAEELEASIRDLRPDRPVVVYCVYGFQVSGEAAVELRRRGFDARALAGGITAWHAMGGPTIALPRP